MLALFELLFSEESERKTINWITGNNLARFPENRVAIGERATAAYLHFNTHYHSFLFRNVSLELLAAVIVFRASHLCH